jgi:hypothetical protein
MKFSRSRSGLHLDDGRSKTILGFTGNVTNTVPALRQCREATITFLVRSERCKPRISSYLCGWPGGDGAKPSWSQSARENTMRNRCSSVSRS